MDSNDTKQIIIGYNAIKDACDAILKPIRINLNDTETAMKMSKVQVDILEYIQAACEGIQKDLRKVAMEYGISYLKESIYNDGEIDEARKMIKDILLDVKPVPNPSSKANHMANEAIGVAQRTEKALYL